MLIEYRHRRYEIEGNSLDLSIKAIKNISEIENLENLIDLKILKLSGNRITEINGLENLISLEILDLSHNQISKIENLENLSSLKVLNLSGNIISEIKNLNNLNFLEELFLSGNRISEIKGLENLINLKKLFLPGNILNEIKGLENLHDLTVLNLINNEIIEISGLEFLFNLESIELDENKIREDEFDLIEKNPQDIIIYCQNKYCERHNISREIKSKLGNEFNSPHIGFLMSIIFNKLEFDDEHMNSLISLVNRLKYSKHEGDPVCSSILIIPERSINDVQDKIYPKPISNLSVDNTKEVMAFAHLINGFSGSLLINHSGIVLGNYIFREDDVKFNPIIIRDHLKAAYASKETDGLLFLFCGDGICLIFYKGEFISYRKDETWRLNIRNLESKIHAISLIHSIDKEVLKKVMKIAFEISDIGTGSLISIGDHETVLGICDSSLSKHIQWNPIHLNKFNNDLLLGIMGQDGATVISEGGVIIKSMIVFRPPVGAKGIEESGKGTRHHTAAKVSGITNAICMAISKDGPISIYSKGNLILRIFGD